MCKGAMIIPGPFCHMLQLPYINGEMESVTPNGEKTSGCLPVPPVLCLIFTVCTAVVYSPEVFL